MSTNNPLYEQYFPQGGFHILDPLNPNTFSERPCPDREYDFTPTYPEIQSDGSIIRAVIPGFEKGYGLDSSGPPTEWYSARGERAENQSEGDTPFYHLHLFDSPAQTMETAHECGPLFHQRPQGRYLQISDEFPLNHI